TGTRGRSGRTTQPRRILEPNISFGRTGFPHSSQSTTAIEENGAPHDLQRRSNSPPHCGHASGISASNSSNQRFAAPQPRQNATQSPSTFRRSSRNQSAAFAIGSWYAGAVPEDRAPRPPRGNGAAGHAARDREAERLRAARRPRGAVPL